MTINVKESPYSAVGDGISDDRSAFLLADAQGATISVPKGAYLIGSNATLNSHIEMSQGAVFLVGNGVTLTLNGGIDATLNTTFICSGTGRVVFDTAKQTTGFPEWWGAVANKSSADCLSAINACIIACPVTQLQAADYWVSGTVLLQTAHRKIIGAGKSWTAAGNTRLVINDANATAVLMGYATNPGTINGQLQHVYMQDLAVVRAPQIGSGTAIGISVQWTLFSECRNVEALEHKRGFHISGTVQAKFKDCYAFRSGVSTSPSTDSFYGYFLNGSSGLAAAGGNASTYFTDCTASCGLTAAQCPTNIGFGLAGAAADTFMLRPEVTSCLQGLVMAGSGTISGDADVHISGAVFDDIKLHGFLISGVVGAVNITDCYAAPSGIATSYYGIVVINSQGITLKNNQWMCWPAASVAGGVRVDSSTLVSVKDDIILGAAKPLEVNASCTCSFEPIINNPTQACSQGAVYITGSTNRCTFAPSILGGANVFAYGINLVGTPNVLNEINCTKIFPPALNGGSNKKVYINGAAVTVTGTTGANIISGIMS
jgi:hypothetical protein